MILLKIHWAIPVIGLVVACSSAQAAWLVDSAGIPLNRTQAAAATPSAPPASPKLVSAAPEPVAMNRIPQLVYTDSFQLEDDSRLIAVDNRQFDEEQRRLGSPLWANAKKSVKPPAPVSKPVATTGTASGVQNLRMGQ